MNEVPKYRIAALSALFSVIVGVEMEANAESGVLTGATLTNVIDAGAARPGIAIGGVLYDPAVDRLFLAGDSDFNTPDANLYEFTTDGTPISETLAGTRLIDGIAPYPASSDFTIVQGDTLSRITRDGTVVSSRELDGVTSLAGVALNPATGRLWVVESIGATDALLELDADFNLLRTVSLGSLFPGENNILGLEIDPFTGNFLGSLSSLSSTTLESSIVEFDSDVTTVLSSLQIVHAGWDSLTSVSIGGPPGARRLYVSSGTSDLVFEFQFNVVPEPDSAALLTFVLGTAAICGGRPKGRPRESATRVGLFTAT